MTTFYGESLSFSTSEYTEFANNFLKTGTLPTINPWICHASNTWQNSDTQTPSNEVLKDWQKNNEVKLVVDDKGDVKILLVSAPAEHEIAFIDWISFSLKRYTFSDHYIGIPEEFINDSCIEAMGKS